MLYVKWEGRDRLRNVVSWLLRTVDNESLNLGTGQGSPARGKIGNIYIYIYIYSKTGPEIRGLRSRGPFFVKICPIRCQIVPGGL